MTKNTRTPGHSPKLTKLHKLSVAGVATLGAATLAFSLAPSHTQTTTSDAAISAAPVAFSQQPIKNVQASVTDQQAGASLKTQAIEAQKKSADAAAKKAAENVRKVQAASRSVQRPAIETVAMKTYATKTYAAQTATTKTYANNLDGWIRQSLDIMKRRGIPGSYNGLHRNIMRESSGNPMAINGWDINAINGIPSKGLLQVIPPTFKAYHVPGTSWNIYDPVANITAAANYAADKYGSMDNVNSAY
ncbi:transglycosylase SLT domain-containing protein [Streptomyces olivochromogenes]|uniref:transglycosylase SLT domain-containing protein n=1 Tax=Streptomyces olivochromogenes TaxID=1963 RepID=UPI003699C533